MNTSQKEFKGTNISKVIKLFFECNYFTPLTKVDYDVLTCATEWNNKFSTEHITDLSYDFKLNTKDYNLKSELEDGEEDDEDILIKNESLKYDNDEEGNFKQIKHYKLNYEQVFYADTETDVVSNTSTIDDKKFRCQHKIYLLCVIWYDKTGVMQKKSFTGDNIVNNFLHFINKETNGKPALVLFHNAKYDCSLLISEFYRI